MIGGAVLSPEDKRDWPVGAAMEISDVELPDNFAVWQPPAENQDKTNNCVAQAVANIFECVEYQVSQKHIDYSVGYIYGNRKDYFGSGMIPREANSAAIKDGDIYRIFWDSNAEVPEIIAGQTEAMKTFKDYARKLKGYVRLQTLTEIKRFILKFGLPVMIIAPSEEFDPYATGHHAVAAYGWQEGKILYTNSWGGDGRGQIDYNKITEAWGLMPNDLSFPDVQKSRWSHAAIQEAANDGIIIGYEDGTFRPQAALTREELAVIWQRMKRHVQKMIQAGFIKG